MENNWGLEGEASVSHRMSKAFLMLQKRRLISFRKEGGSHK